MIQKGILSLFILHMAFITFSQQNNAKSLDINLDNFAYPFAVSYIQVKNQQQELRMAYMDVKPMTPNGEIVMLLHGKNFNGAYWEQTARRLSEQGYRVVIPDQIGFGKSSKPKTFQYTFQQLAANTLSLLDSLHVDKVSVVGHSMGGMLATRFTLMFPQRVDKFVLVNPIGLEDWKLKIPYQPVDKLYENELKQNYESLKKYQMQNYYDGKWRSDYDKWVNILAGWTMNSDYPIIAWNSALTSEMIFTQPVVYEFQNVRNPSLLIIGQRDRTAIGKNLLPEELRSTVGDYPKLGRETQRKLPNAKLVELHNVGHLPHIEAFDRFIKPLIAFLDE